MPARQRLEFFRRKLCGPRLQKGCLRHGTRCTWSPGTQSWQWWKWVFYLKLFMRPRVNEIGVFTGTSTRRLETGWSLQPLKSLYTFTQTAKWWLLLVMLTNCLGCASNEDAQLQCDLKWSCCTLSCRQITARVRPELQSCQVAELLILAKSPSCESLLRDSARLGQPWGWTLYTKPRLHHDCHPRLMRPSASCPVGNM